MSRKKEEKKDDVLDREVDEGSWVVSSSSRTGSEYLFMQNSRTSRFTSVSCSSLAAAQRAVLCCR